jgi:hypothetical protein
VIGRLAALTPAAFHGRQPTRCAGAGVAPADGVSISPGCEEGGIERELRLRRRFSIDRPRGLGKPCSLGAARRRCLLRSEPEQSAQTSVLTPQRLKLVTDVRHVTILHANVELDTCAVSRSNDPASRDHPVRIRRRGARQRAAATGGARWSAPVTCRESIDDRRGRQEVRDTGTNSSACEARSEEHAFGACSHRTSGRNGRQRTRSNAREQASRGLRRPE